MNGQINKDFPLVSIFLISYNNCEYIYEALDSIVGQSYCNIELVVSDDCSIDFKRKHIKKYIKEKKQPNIRNVIVNKNPKNVGTVRHLEFLRKMSTGQLVCVIAADDKFCSTDAVQHLVNCYLDFDKKYRIVSSLTMMCDNKLEKQFRVFTSSQDVDLINSDDTKKLFEELSYRCILPSSGTIIEKSIYDEIGDFNDYVYVEDWSFHLRVTRMGIKIHILPIVTNYHRDGGISHGNTRGNEKIYIQFCKDLLTLYEKEVQPYTSTMSEDAANKSKQNYEREKRKLDQYLKSEEHLSKLKTEEKKKATLMKIKEYFHIKR